MKKNYITPSLEVSVFETQDILTASIQEDSDFVGNIDIYSPIQWEDELSNN